VYEFAPIFVGSLHIQVYYVSTPTLTPGDTCSLAVVLGSSGRQREKAGRSVCRAAGPEFFFREVVN